MESESSFLAVTLVSEKEYVDFFFDALKTAKNAQLTCNWITSELFGLLKKHILHFHESLISAPALGELVTLIDSGQISGKIAKQVFEIIFETGEMPKVIVEREGLSQISDPDKIREFVKESGSSRENFQLF